MKKPISIFISLLAVFSCFCTYAQNCWEYEESPPVIRRGGSVVITEIYFDSRYSENIERNYHHFGEYIELFNSSTEDIDISGWKLKDHHTFYIFPSNTVIGSGDFLLLTTSGRDSENGMTPSQYGKFKFFELFPELESQENYSKTIAQPSYVLYNKKATIELFNNNGFLIDKVAYQLNDQSQDLNFGGELDNGSGGVFNGSIREEYRKSIYLADQEGYYDQGFVNEPYMAATATPFSIPYNIELLPPSEAIWASPQNPAEIADPSLNKNFVQSESYDVFGQLTGKQVSYFNSLGKKTISYSWDPEQNKVWGSEVLYDKSGRPAINTFIAPSCEGFVSNPDFLRGDYDDYVGNEENYDDLGSIDASNNSFSPLKRYYSNENTNEPYQAVTSTPFVRTVYDRLNPGAVVKSIGGEKINGEWKTGYSYTMPALQELYYIFGKDYFKTETTSQGSLIKTKFFKQVFIDPEGKESVIFKDGEGNILASAKSGGNTSYEVLAVIGEQGYIDVHLPKNLTGGYELFGWTGYTIFDLKTGHQLSDHSEMEPGGIYRISHQANSNGNSYITSTGELTRDSGTRGIRYNVNYYDFSLNYLDKKDRIIKSIPPLGFNSSCLNANIQNTVNHEMASTYQYNTMGELVQAESPDEGISKFKYRKDGQIRFSQNAKQAQEGKVSYTNYDPEARPIKSGVAFKNFSSLDPDQDLAYSASDREITRTLYDTPDQDLGQVLMDNNLDIYEYKQTFLSGNVSKTWNEHPHTSTTWYSYDAYGRVTWVLKDVDGLGPKTIHYSYDHKGNVEKVIFQKDDNSERFVHRYSYNKNNELIKLETSKDDINYKTQATYTYYKTGEIKRVEINEGLQGLDYVYTINGALKAINHATVSHISKDPGHDGNDVFGLFLDYYQGDYTRSNTYISSSTAGNDNFDGNIKSVRWRTQGLGSAGYIYDYNENNYLLSATFGNLSGNNISPLQQYKVSNLSYDANGNIITLRRNGNNSGTGYQMDNLSYSYKPGTNQLDHVVDDAFSQYSYNDIESQNPGNYVYNEIGQLEKDLEGDIDIEYKYTASGLVSEVSNISNGLPLVKFHYDDAGRRLKKESYTNSGQLLTTTHYIRDLTGNPLGIYVNSTLEENPIYGGSRIGVHYRLADNDVYQISDHLGNARALMEKNDNDVVLEQYDFYGSGNTGLGYFNAYGNGDINIYHDALRVIASSNGDGVKKTITLESGKKYKLELDLDRSEVSADKQVYIQILSQTTNDMVYDDILNNNENSISILLDTEIEETGNYDVYIFIAGGPEAQNDSYVQQQILKLDNYSLKDLSMDVLAYSDYYPFGSKLPNRNIEGNYRYAYQGQEKDTETGKEAFQLRLWDSRTGRWLTPDPSHQYSSPYKGMGNNPLSYLDEDGRWAHILVGAIVGGGIAAIQVAMTDGIDGFKDAKNWKKIGLGAGTGALIAATGGAGAGLISAGSNIVDQTLIEGKGVRDISWMDVGFAAGAGVGANKLGKVLDPFAKKIVRKLAIGRLNGRGDFGARGAFAGGFKNKWWYDYRSTNAAIKNMIADPLVSNASFFTNQLLKDFQSSYSTPTYIDSQIQTIMLPEIILNSNNPTEMQNQIETHLKNNL